MTLSDLLELFQRVDNYLDQDHILPVYHHTSYLDLDVFILLGRLVLSEPITHMPTHRRDIIACAEHDRIWLNIDLERLAQAATDDDITALQQMGVHLDTDTQSLSMFV